MIISFTGFDGVGKSTNVDMLVNRLANDYDMKAISLFDITNGTEVYNNPNDIDEIYCCLKKYDVISTRFYMRNPHLQRMQEELMYAEADIFNNVDLIKEVIHEAYKEACIWYDRVISKLDNQNKIVVLDRYFYDEIAYRSLYNISKSEIEKLYSDFKKPDLSFYLHLSVEKIKSRNIGRSDMNTALFKLDKKMYELYQTLLYIQKNYELKFISVENKTREQINDEIFLIIEKFICQN